MTERTCIIPQCESPVELQHVCCRRHWGRINVALQKTLMFLHNQGRPPRPGYHDAIANAVLQFRQRRR